LRPEICKFLARKLKREVDRQATAIPSQLHVQPFGRDVINSYQVRVEHYVLTANGMDCWLNHERDAF
jgi:hypothetical protein